MKEDTIKDIIKTARGFAKQLELLTSHDIKCGFENIGNRLERLSCATPEAEEKHELKIGCQPAVYKRGDGHFTAIAHNNQMTTYVMDIKHRDGRVVGQFLINNKEMLTMEGKSFLRVIRCLASASNAYIAANQHAADRRRRAEKKNNSVNPV
jgi:hypothetical protein